MCELRPHISTLPAHPQTYLNAHIASKDASRASASTNTPGEGPFSPVDDATQYMGAGNGIPVICLFWTSCANCHYESPILLSLL